jgi:hypothetical protein
VLHHVQPETLLGRMIERTITSATARLDHGSGEAAAASDVTDAADPSRLAPQAAAVPPAYSNTAAIRQSDEPRLGVPVRKFAPSGTRAIVGPAVMFGFLVGRRCALATQIGPGACRHRNLARNIHEKIAANEDRVEDVSLRTDASIAIA